MFLSNLDNNSHRPIADSLLQELRSIRDDCLPPPNLHLIVLPGTIGNHHLNTYNTSSVAPRRHNTLPHGNVANFASGHSSSYDTSTQNVDDGHFSSYGALIHNVDDFIVNSFRNFNLNRTFNANNNFSKRAPPANFNKF